MRWVYCINLVGEIIILNGSFILSVSLEIWVRIIYIVIMFGVGMWECYGCSVFDRVRVFGLMS